MPTIGSIKNLLTSLEDSTQREIAPHAVYRQRPTSFHDKQQQDCSEYLDFILNQMHEEEKTCTAGESSIVEKSFGGVLSFSDVCLTCQSRSEKNEKFFDLKLPYPQLTKIDTAHVNSSTPGHYTVQRLLDSFLSHERIHKNCDGCGVSCDFARRANVQTKPEHLILVLKNFESNVSGGLRKLMNTVYCDKQVAIYERSPCGVTHNMYQLYAVVVHKGTNMKNGHYYTFATNEGDEWFKFDDDNVTRIEYCDVNRRGIEDTPYILMYKCLRKEEIAVSREWSQKMT